MSKEILVIYHGFCDDGFGAALAAYLKFGDTADYVGMQYIDPMPDMKNKKVYIFDFSFPPEILLNPELGAKSITMLDHHLSAFEDWNTEYFYDDVKDITVRFNMNKSGAMLAWEFLFPTTQAPILFLHIQDNDLWKFSMEETKPFIRNLRSYPMNFKVWIDLLNYTNGPQGYDLFVIDGQAQQRSFDSQLAYILEKSQTKEVTISGIKGLAINANGTFASELGDTLSVRCGTFGLVYSIEKDMMKCSLRSQKSGTCNVKVLGKLFGGGGHKNASGMVMDIKTFTQQILGII